MLKGMLLSIIQFGMSQQATASYMSEEGMMRSCHSEKKRLEKKNSPVLTL